MKRSAVVDPAVVGLIEAAERQMVDAQVAALSEEQARRRDRKVLVVGDAVLEIESRSPGSRAARISGFGTAGTVSTGDLDRVLDLIAEERADTIQFRVLPGAQVSEIAGWLVGAGFRRKLREINWIAPTTSARPASPDYDIRLVGPDEGMTFAKIVAVNYHYKPGTDLTALADECAAPGFATFLAYVDGVAVGTGRMYGAGSVCGFGYGTTLARYRKRGIQGEMIAARLRHARDAGYEWAIAATWGNDRSSRNLARQGFRKAHEVEVYVRAREKPTENIK